MIRSLVHLVIPSSARAAIRHSVRRLLPSSTRLRLRHAGWSRWCPVCNSPLRRFLPCGPKPEAWCPVCKSLERQRLYWLYLREELSDARHRKLLHMAPEDGLARRLRALPGVDYVSGDPCSPRAMMKFDLARVPFDDCTFDVIVISHVLQHIQQEREALAELRRVLKPDGWILMNESFRDGPTLENSHAIPPEQRKAYHGFDDHTFIRVYGTDFGDRLRSHGLLATFIPFGDRYDAAQRQRMGLGRPKNFYIVKKGP